MSFLFGKRLNAQTNKEKEAKSNYCIDLIDFDIGSYQPNNPFKDLILLPYFSSIVRQICVLSDEKRIVVGDDDGNLSVWSQNGNLIANLKYHKASITSIIQFLDSSSFKIQNYIAVSSNDKNLSIWDTDTYQLLKTTNLSSNINRLFISLSFNDIDFMIVAGIDIKLYDTDLFQVDEFKRKKRDNSVKHMIKIKDDKFVAASNYDLEIYGLVDSSSDFRLKELKCHANAHSDTILYLNKISDTMFASSSTNGILTLWHTDHLVKIIDLKPFDELNKNESMFKQNLTCITCFKPFYERFLIICSGAHISIYDISLNQFVCKISNAHSSKITDLIILNLNLVTSSEDGSIRIWNFKEAFYSSKNNEELVKTELELQFVGECLGHSASVLLLETASKNEIISTGFDKLVIIWRNSLIIDRIRKININKILSNVSI